MDQKIKMTASATRIFWVPVNFKDYEINVGIQLKNDNDVSQLSNLDLFGLLDTVDQTSVQSNVLELIMISDVLYNYVADYYTQHDVHVNIMNFGQPVLSTNYLFNNLPL